MESFQEMPFISTQSMSLLCISMLSIVILYFGVKRRDLSKSPQLIPHPPKLPFIGNIHQLSSLYHQSLYSLSLKYGPLMLVHFGEVPWLVVSSSDMASAVMRTRDLTFATRPSAVVTDILRFGDLKLVIRETLRLHPPLPLLLPRESMEECEINGYTIPKGTRVMINAWAIGREAKSWEAPEKFMPERFIDSQVDYKGNDFQLIPFGAGRRICPGMLFATATAELVLANLVHRFDWELPSGMTREKFKMDDSPGLSVHRKDELWLVPKRTQTLDY